MPRRISVRNKKSGDLHYVFPYVRFHENTYPLIPVTVKKGRLEVNTFALLDSGASISVFRPEIAKALGLRRKRRKLMRLGTANGGVDIEITPVEIRVMKSKFKSRIGFSDRYAAQFNILGREGFFQHFSVCFNELMRTVILVPIRK
ncbi:MAG: retroviral-like aspartic protease family protein [Elusimicrobia bacterium]|nr:retroviral-like aspartic protease family protein [Candidatus Obscuribacterium magneticum]